ncbi:MAG: hypothetical protein ACOCUI_04710 [bacterium]
MPKANKVCLNPDCKKEYYCCKACVDINSWKRVTCSPKCFQDYMKYLENKKKGEVYFNR